MHSQEQWHSAFGLITELITCSQAHRKRNSRTTKSASIAIFALSVTTFFSHGLNLGSDKAKPHGAKK